MQFLKTLSTLWFKNRGKHFFQFDTDFDSSAAHLDGTKIINLLSLIVHSSINCPLQDKTADKC